MRFNINGKADSFFKEIRRTKGNGFDTDFDAYYYCVMAGIAKGRQRDLRDDEENRSFIDDFVGDYKTHKFEIIALFLNAKLDASRLAPSDRSKVDQELSKYIICESRVRAII